MEKLKTIGKDKFRISYTRFRNGIDNSAEYDSYGENKIIDKINKKLIIDTEYIYHKIVIKDILNFEFTDDEWLILAKKYSKENTYNSLKKYIKFSNREMEDVEYIPEEYGWDIELCTALNLTKESLYDKNLSIQITDVISNCTYDDEFITINTKLTISII